ncbi:MAG: ROK family protein [Micrococcales bacterium]|nr:ROK family protein [Micrococcales bacterium]NBR54386.1 ROK family protein [Micrococcales bacterium]NBR60322.1 ROK family protein [Actinomycetota bacterium]NBY43493.1 ROK family protein [Micrococcales bacterium]
MKTVGIDIGGTKIAGVLLGADDSVIREDRVPTPANDPEAIIEAVVHLVEDLRAGEELLAVGVAAAGFINASQSEVMYSPNLNWRNEPLKAKLESRLGLPVFIENDANAAGWAEHRFGAAKGISNMMMITIGTGVGGAIVTDGRLFRGGFGIGAELGHWRFVPNGKPCGCGQRGCLEQYASGTALLNNAKDLVNSGVEKAKRLLELSGGAENLDGQMIFEAIQENDPAALELLEELGTNIGIAIASMVAILDPEVAVIGGGVSLLGDRLLQPIRRAYLEHLPAKGFRPEISIVAALLTNEAGAIGAADLARAHSSSK